MTLRKYKKLLMSFGLDRDLAEYEKEIYARFRRALFKNRYHYQPTSEYEYARAIANAHIYKGNTGLKKLRKYIRNRIKEAEVC